MPQQDSNRLAMHVQPVERFPPGACTPHLVGGKFPTSCTRILTGAAAAHPVAARVSTYCAHGMHGGHQLHSDSTSCAQKQLVVHASVNPEPLMLCKTVVKNCSFVKCFVYYKDLDVFQRNL